MVQQWRRAAVVTLAVAVEVAVAITVNVVTGHWTVYGIAILVVLATVVAVFRLGNGDSAASTLCPSRVAVPLVSARTTGRSTSAFRIRRSKTMKAADGERNARAVHAEGPGAVGVGENYGMINILHGEYERLASYYVDPRSWFERLRTHDYTGRDAFTQEFNSFIPP